MTDKIPAAIARAIDEVDQSEQIAAVEAKVDEVAASVPATVEATVDQRLEGHRAEIDDLKAKVAHLLAGLAHFLPPLKD